MERIKGNLDLFEFALTDHEMDALRALDTRALVFDGIPGPGEIGSRGTVVAGMADNPLRIGGSRVFFIYTEDTV